MRVETEAAAMRVEAQAAATAAGLAVRAEASRAASRAKAVQKAGARWRPSSSEWAGAQSQSPQERWRGHPGLG